MQKCAWQVKTAEGQDCQKKIPYSEDCQKVENRTLRGSGICLSESIVIRQISVALRQISVPHTPPVKSEPPSDSILFQRGEPGDLGGSFRHFWAPPSKNRAMRVVDVFTV